VAAVVVVVVVEEEEKVEVDGATTVCCSRAVAWAAARTLARWSRMRALRVGSFSAASGRGASKRGSRSLPLPPPSGPNNPVQLKDCRPQGALKPGRKGDARLRMAATLEAEVAEAEEEEKSREACKRFAARLVTPPVEGLAGGCLGEVDTRGGETPL